MRACLRLNRQPPRHARMMRQTALTPTPMPALAPVFRPEADSEEEAGVEALELPTEVEVGVVVAPVVAHCGSGRRFARARSKVEHKTTRIARRRRRVAIGNAKEARAIAGAGRRVKGPDAYPGRTGAVWALVALEVDVLERCRRRRDPRHVDAVLRSPGRAHCAITVGAKRTIVPWVNDSALVGRCDREVRKSQ
ncbi:hypothetical protein HC256_006200 [Beauveria bassiana]|nr:hypothetical protein HC256_006200 [Beauveria bassiana]